jgi:hypothetical protein
LQHFSTLPLLKEGSVQFSAWQGHSAILNEKLQCWHFISSHLLGAESFRMGWPHLQIVRNTSLEQAMHFSSSKIEFFSCRQTTSRCLHSQLVHSFLSI